MRGKRMRRRRIKVEEEESKDIYLITSLQITIFFCKIEFLQGAKIE